MKSFRRSIKAAKGFKWTYTGLTMDFLLDFLKKKEKGSGEEASLQTSPLQKQILPVLLLPIQNINSEALEIVYK